MFTLDTIATDCEQECSESSNHDFSFSLGDIFWGVLLE